MTIKMLRKIMEEYDENSIVLMKDYARPDPYPWDEFKFIDGTMTTMATRGYTHQLNDTKKKSEKTLVIY